jgi:hypothetical protein
MPHHFTPGRTLVPLIGHWVGPRSGLEIFEKVKHSCFCQQLKLGFAAHSMVTIPSSMFFELWTGKSTFEKVLYWTYISVQICCRQKRTGSYSDSSMSISFFKYFVCGHNMDYIQEIKRRSISKWLLLKVLGNVLCEESDCWFKVLKRYLYVTWDH